jgi:hypothetical protein
VYKEVVKNKTLFVALGILLATILGVHSMAQTGTIGISNEITFQDPNNSQNYMVVDTGQHSFYIHQSNGEQLSGTYTETSQSYNLKYDQGFGQTAIKTKDGVISPRGNVWVKK